MGARSRRIHSVSSHASRRYMSLPSCQVFCLCMLSWRSSGQVCLDHLSRTGGPTHCRHVRHGVPAALIVKLAANTQKANATKPAELLIGMNATLLGQTQRQFVTGANVYLDADLGELCYAAAAPSRGASNQEAELLPSCRESTRNCLEADE